MKRTFDAIAASVSLMLLCVPMFLIAVLVRLSLGRPVWFIQKRAGHGGRSFNMVKFRTMTEAVDAEGRLLPDVERVTVLGRFLRRSRLDELPELWLIMIGEMSLVGPRPLYAEMVQSFGPLGDKRNNVRPGLTGWAQVNGNTLLDPEVKIAMDIWYVDHRSFWLDIRILLKTIQVVIFGERLNEQSINKAVGYAFGSDRRR
jgi:lipopolysaccharide/colanic/teichoic acid biosynthesis glycosyltransferase